MIRPGADRMLSRRRLLAAASVALTGSLVGGCGAPPKRLKVSAGTWLGYEPLFIASQQGWTDPELVELHRVPSNSSSVRALEAGIADAAALTIDETMRARASGLDLQVVLVFNKSVGADKILARPGINRVADLQGKRVGLARNSYAALMLGVALNQAGLGHEACTIVDMQMGSQLDEWQRGSVDAVVTYDPVASDLLALGAIDIFDTREAPDLIVDVLAVQRAGIADPGLSDSIANLVDGYFQARRFLREQPETADPMMAAGLAMSVDELRLSREGLIRPDLQTNLALLDQTDPGLANSAADIARLMQEMEIVDNSISANNLFDPQFVRRLIGK